MAHKIKDLREKMDSFSKEVSQFKLEPGASQGPLENMDERETHSFVESADVIGREEERKRIVAVSCLRGSKVVITTRSLKVSSVMKSSENLQLRPLPDDICWDLFQSRAFEAGATQSERLVAIGKEIVKKCVGIPLAAQALGSLLLFKREEVDWRENERDGHTVFNDLLWRSFFLEAKKDEDGQVRKCKLHDLMHDLARWVAGKHLCTVTKDISGDTVNKKTYHLLIDEWSFKLGMLEETKKAKSLRTLLILRCNPIEKSFLSRIFVMLRCLRVLDLSSSQIKVIPDSVGCLIHLRYLDLSSSLIELLPESIGYLLNLQVLKLPNTKIKKLPESLRKLQSLRHLDIRRCILLTDMPVGVARLTHLQTLTDFVVGKKKTSCGLGELKELDLSGELFIRHLENFKPEGTEVEHTILSNKEYLVSLRLTWHHHTNSTSNNDSERALDLLRPHKNLKRLQLHSYNGLKFPPWLSDSLLTSLVEVKLTYCTKCEHLPSFGGIASLKDLQIIGMHEVRQISVEFYGTGLVKGFPSLEKLAFFDMPKLEEWSVLEVMPFSQLMMLTIGKCPALRSIPWVQSLQKLDLSHCSSSLLASLPNTSNLPVLSSLLMDNIQGLTFLPDGFLLCFSSLRKLIVSSCMQLEHLPLIDMQQLVTLQSLEIFDCPQLNSLAFNAVQLTCLRNLNIRNCRSLESLPQNWTGITSLQSISIADCRNVTSWTEMDIEGLSSVSDFSLEICNNKRNVSGWLRHLTNLQTLTIHGAHDNRHPQPGKLITGNSFTICCCGDGLGSLLQGLSSASSLEHLKLEYISGIALPDSIGEIQSLQYLSIHNCAEFASLPNSLRGLTRLEGLWIQGCPLLERRCQRNIGEDWSIISHVRIVEIGYRNLTPDEPERRESRSCDLVCNCCQFRTR
ncbi:putative disease resistance protein RGA1 [Carex littledalei]|uniref:Putative disease resistance protein RGA1 n=1 Tax=Carex littledalei TaxID=544730 RepID=A0A833RFF5_9POAL|nr:putative disease resistance protein RGA1 [Carex littledalei]